MSAPDRQHCALTEPSAGASYRDTDALCVPLCHTVYVKLGEYGVRRGAAKEETRD